MRTEREFLTLIGRVMKGPKRDITYRRQHQSWKSKQDPKHRDACIAQAQEKIARKN